jgi:hypothetical protein
MMSNKEFKIDDIVSMKANGLLIQVTGVIHDDERLFVTGHDAKEFEVSFDDVDEQFRKVETIT